MNNRPFLTGILIALVAILPAKWLASSRAEPPCANTVFLPEGADPDKESLCIDGWVSINQQVAYLLFGSSAPFNLNNPMYELIVPIIDEGVVQARNAAGTSFLSTCSISHQLACKAPADLTVSLKRMPLPSLVPQPTAGSCTRT